MIPVTVTFYRNVGFDRSYNHVIDFSNETEREDYFSSRILKIINNCAYNKPMNSIQIRCNYEEALNFTYCKFIIGSNPSHQKKIFAWVDDVVLKTDQKDENGNYVPILEVNIAIDPWQTFLFNFTLGESFVAREHVDRFIKHNDGTRGFTLPNTADNFSCGAEKRGTSIYTLRNSVTLKNVDDVQKSMKIYWILVQYIPTGYSNMTNILIPMTLYENRLFLQYGNSSTYGVTVSYGDVLDGTFLSLYGINPESVASAYLIPFDIASFTLVSGTTNKYKVAFNLVENLQTTEHLYPTTEAPTRRIYYEIGDTQNIAIYKEIDLNVSKPSIPSVNEAFNIDNEHEPQLYKEPYRRMAFIDEFGVERGNLPDITANAENPFTKVVFTLIFDSVDARLRIQPKIKGSNNVIFNLDNKYWFEYTLVKIDIYRSNWLTYLLESRETDRQMIQSQINQQAIATAVGGVSGATSMGGMQALSEKGNVVGGVGLGLGLGAIQTVGNYVANQHFAFQQQDIREKAVRRKANNVIQSGTFKSVISDCYFCFVRTDDTTFNMKSLEFHKYGYSIYRYETPNIKTRKYFNFIATNIVKIDGSLNNNIKMALMEIFNNGVTIWHGDYISELAGIGDYSKENIERSLL